MDSKRAINDEPSFGFLMKIKFMARQNMDVIRSKGFVHSRPDPDGNLWNRKPPDFSSRFYRSSTIPKSPSQSGKVDPKIANSLEKFSQMKSSQKQEFPELVTKKQPSNIVCSFKILDPFEAKIMFVKDGKHKMGVFEDLKPHDFRQYDANVPNFVTSFDRDPFNLKLKSKQLNADRGLPADITHQNIAFTKSFNTYKTPELKWDPQLILKKESWPLKSASYTKHARSRGTYIAFIDRVDEKLTKWWQKEREVQQRLLKPMNTSDKN